MSFDNFRRVIDEASEFVLETDLFGGGEPLLHRQIFEIIEYAHKSGLRTRMHTNATRLSAEASVKLLNAGLDFLSLSFEGYDRETYERQRVNADYHVTLENITGFLQKKRELGARLPYTVVQAVEGGDSANGRDLVMSKLSALLSGLPVDEVKVIPQHNFGGTIATSKHEHNSYKPCTFPWYSMYVLWDGTIVPCCLDWWGDYSLGNIASTSLREAWQSDKMVRLREALASGEVSEVPLCVNCDRLWQKSRFGVPTRTIRALRSFLR